MKHFVALNAMASPSSHHHSPIGTEAMAMDEDRDADEALHRELRAQHKLQQQQEQEEYPDEVDVPTDIAARVRFQKYRCILQKLPRLGSEALG